MFPQRRIIFWLAVVLQSVNALNSAAPYEMVYLYMAYKMEYATVAAGSRKIAPLCKKLPAKAGSPLAVINENVAAEAVTEGVEGICTLSEFMSLIQTNAWRSAMKSKIPTPRFSDPASINDPLTTTLNPNADRLAAAVNDPATIGAFSLLTRPSFLYSEADLTAMGGHPPEWFVPWSKQMQKASEIVENSRQIMEDRLAADPGNAELQTIYDRFQKTLSTAIDNLNAIDHFRTGSAARFLVPDQTAHVSWTSSPMSTHGVIDARQYQRIDGTPSMSIVWAPDVKDDKGVIITPGHQVISTNFQVVNFEDSWAAAEAAGSPLTDAQKQALKDFAAAWGTVNGPDATEKEKLAKAHRDITDTTKFARDLHLKLVGPSTPDACPPP